MARFHRRSSTPADMTPRFLTLRFPGPCAECRQYLSRGTRAFYEPMTKRLWGMECGHGEAAAYARGPINGAAYSPSEAAQLGAKAKTMASLTAGPRIADLQAAKATVDELDRLCAAEPVTDFENGLQVESMSERHQ